MTGEPFPRFRIRQLQPATRISATVAGRQLGSTWVRLQRTRRGYS